MRGRGGVMKPEFRVLYIILMVIDGANTDDNVSLMILSVKATFSPF